jgi:DNA anti-recombination protein RmuC
MEKQLSKAEMAKSKLEELCRELNKANKNEKELNQQRLKSLQLTHGETVNGLKHTLSEIQESVAAKQEHTKRVAEVEKLSTHLNELVVGCKFLREI